MRAILPLVILFALIVSGCVVMGAYFAYAALRNDHRTALEYRLSFATERIATTAERSLALGIAVPEQTTLGPLLRREARLESLARVIDVLDTEGRIVFSSDPARHGEQPAAADGIPVSGTIDNDIGDAVGRVVLRYSPAVNSAAADSLWNALVPLVIATACGAGIATLVLGMILARGPRRAAARAADTATWPPMAQRTARHVESVHHELERRLGSGA